MQAVTKDTIELARVDQDYNGERAATAAAKHRISIEVLKLPEAKAVLNSSQGAASPSQTASSSIQLVRAGAEALRNLRYRVPPLRDLHHRVTFEFVNEIGLPHRRLLSSKLGPEASRNLGATQKAALRVKHT